MFNLMGKASDHCRTKTGHGPVPFSFSIEYSNVLSYLNFVPISQYMSTMYNPMTNSNVMSYSNQIRQLYGQRAINNSQAQQQLQQQQKN